MKEGNERIGLISLWSAIGGLIISVIPATIFLILHEKEILDNQGLFWLCAAVFVISQIIALATGIVARDTSAGKVGLLVSIISIIAGILVVLFVTPINQTKVMEAVAIAGRLLA